jgi:hypothetical protein
MNKPDDISSERWERLPKWAQNYISRVSADRDSLERERQAVSTGESRVWSGLIAQGLKDPIYLNEKDSVFFRLPPFPEVAGQEAVIQVRLTQCGTALEVHQNVGQIVVEGKMSNVLHLRGQWR